MAGIYIHIPFCKQSCSYCNFHFSTSLKQKKQLIDAIKNEIVLQKDYLHEEPVCTIYFGGGTPSVLSYEELVSIVDVIHKNYDISVGAEFTLEANPDDLERQKLEEIKSAGVNRLSIGVQSFFEEDLRFMNRAHNSQQAIDSINHALKTGINNISIDLIYGTPTLPDKNWISNLEKAYCFDIPHISAYCLTVEPKTPLYFSIHKKKMKNIDEDSSIRQFEILMRKMKEKEFIHYEISNFSKKGFHSKHNCSYWKEEKYLGIGPSSHSFDGNSRQWNISNNAKYIKSLNEGKSWFEKETLTIEQKYNEYVMLSLRTMWGCNLQKMKEKFGDKIMTVFRDGTKNFIQKGLIIHNNNTLILSDKGKLFADKISASLFIL